ncbi:phospholipase C, phosphocholine-specific [Paludibacterium sp. THUN1379]|nr:phospholipase C, phosphocholine-specific [Paludibacterium sp. THUN1379]
MQRRAFLQSLAAAIGSLSLPALQAQTLFRALQTAPARRHGSLQDIEHIVIFMQENRSFDHYFGCLRGVRGFSDPRAILLPGGRSVFQQPRLPGGGGGVIEPFHLDSRRTGALCMPSLPHGWKVSQHVWRHHDAWAWSKGAATMGYFRREDIPFYYALADAFTLCDAYHASIQGPTDPNRLFLMSGTSGQTVANLDDGNHTADMARDRQSYRGYRWKTVAERLEEAGVSWQVYQEYDNYGDNALAYFANFRNLDRQSRHYQRGRAIVPGSSADNAASSDARYLVDAFARDVQQGTLPQVSWIVAPESFSEHPSRSPALGEWLSARLLAALVANPAVWSRTVFLQMYDENDGLFDHLPMPIPPLQDKQGRSNVPVTGESYLGEPIGLGPRVPMLVISPWSKGGWVCSEQFDHTSVIRLLEARFGIHDDNISPWRRAVCGDLTRTLDLSQRDPGWPSLPDPASYLAAARAACTLPRPQPGQASGRPAQEPGQRPSRALPYRLACQASVKGDALTLSFDNQGETAACLIVYGDDPYRPDGPWHYTLAGQSRLQETWHTTLQGGRYGLSVHGPNGWLRRFAGSRHDPGLSSRWQEDPARHQIHLWLRNEDTRPCTLWLRSAGSTTPSQQLNIAAGSEMHWSQDVSPRADWYDVIVTDSADGKGWLRSTAGAWKQAGMA